MLRGRGAQAARRRFPGKAEPWRHTSAICNATAPAQLLSQASRRLTRTVAIDEESQVAENVRAVGRKTFYRRGGPLGRFGRHCQEQEQKPIKIERFGQQYFDLIDKHGPDVAKYLTFDEPVTVEIGGQAYSF